MPAAPLADHFLNPPHDRSVTPLCCAMLRTFGMARGPVRSSASSDRPLLNARSTTAQHSSLSNEIRHAVAARAGISGLVVRHEAGFGDARAGNGVPDQRGVFGPVEHLDGDLVEVLGSAVGAAQRGGEGGERFFGHGILRFHGLFCTGLHRRVCSSCSSCSRVKAWKVFMYTSRLSAPSRVQCAVPNCTNCATAHPFLLCACSVKVRSTKPDWGSVRGGILACGRASWPLLGRVL
jgi:hypothetical protein